MSKALSWSIEGLDDETLEAARAAARRAGKSLGDWLDELVQQQAARSWREDDESDEDEDHWRTTIRRLAHPAERGGGIRDRRRWRKDPLRRDSGPTPRRPQYFEEAEDGRSDREGELDAKTIVKNAIASFERRAEESERKTARAIESVAELIGERADRDDGLSTIIDRLGRIETKISQQALTSRQPVPGAPTTESRAERPPEKGRSGDFEQALRTLDARLSEIARRLDQDAHEGPARAIASSDDLDRKRVQARGEAATRRPLAEAIAEITQRQRALDFDGDAASGGVRAGCDARLESSAANRFGDIRDAIESVSRQIEALRLEATDQDERQSVVIGRIGDLRREIGGLSRALRELAPRSSIASIEAALRTLADRVEAQRSHGVQENALAAVERLAGDLRSAIKVLDPGPIIRGLHADVQTIARKLEELQSPSGADSAAIVELTRQTSEIRHLLTTVAARPLPLEKLESRLLELTQRVDELSFASGGGTPKDLSEVVRGIRSIVATETSGALQAFGDRLENLGAKIDDCLFKPNGGKRFDELGERIEQLLKSLSARIEQGGHTRDAADAMHVSHLLRQLNDKLDKGFGSSGDPRALEALAEQIRQLSEKLDKGAGLTSHAGTDELLSKPIADAQFEKLARRVDSVYAGLTQRIDESLRSRGAADSAQLAELVGQLARKIDTALDPRADGQAIAALEKQIEKLSHRLDQTDESASALTSIEQTIGDLFRRLEERQAASSKAAENAARRAAQEALREVAAGGGADALNGVIERELAEIRQTHHESGRRTHETLAAVHDTLKRVVDRLAVFEDELTELRSSPSSAVAVRAPAEFQQRAPADAQTGSSIANAPRPRDSEESLGLQSSEAKDFLLEPRARRDPDDGRSSSAKTARDPHGERSVKSDFIAAARRAAQEAAAEAEKAQVANPRKGPSRPAQSNAARQLESVGATLQARKRPLLLALGALVMLIGAYQIARVGMEAPPARVGANGQNAAQNGGESAKSPGQAETARPDIGPSGAPASKFIAPQDYAPAPAQPPLSNFAPGEPSNQAAPSRPPEKISREAIDQTPVGSIAWPGGASAQDQLAALKELAAQGDASAQFELGVRYAEGRGAVRDLKTAAQWLEKSANQGLAPAQYRLGSLYEKGFGVERDYLRARSLYQSAAERGNARAMHNLAVLFAEGGDGKPDYASAVAWFRKAAEFGVRDSQYNLAILYARGLGATQSLKLSYMWFAVAAAQGDDDAAKKRDEVGSRLDSKELAAARALADEFRPQQLDKSANEVTAPPAGGEAGKTRPKAGEKAAGKPKISAM
jgi:localization factor PodJL